MNLWLPWGKMGERDTEGVWHGYVHTAVFEMDS